MHVSPDCACVQRLVGNAEEVAFNDPPSGRAEQMVLNWHLDRLVRLSIPPCRIMLKRTHFCCSLQHCHQPRWVQRVLVQGGALSLYTLNTACPDYSTLSALNDEPLQNPKHIILRV